MDLRRRPSLSNGAKALNLLLDQQTWTHRRVESLAFLANGETRRAISWDFTLPPELAIAVDGVKDRVAVPIATLRKGALKQFDMRDANGRALPVWGAEDNGGLAVDMLVSGLEGVRGDAAPDTARQAISRVVFSAPDDDVATDLALLRRDANDGPSTPDHNVLEAFVSLVATLVDSFVLVVEMPGKQLQARTLLKASYEDDRATTSNKVNLFGSVDIEIDAGGWGDARSWHLEVQAPDGLRVARLRHETWDPDNLDLTSSSLDDDGAGTAHVDASGVSPYDAFSADVRFVPDRSALLNPLTLGAILGSALLWISFAAAGQIAAKLADFGTSVAPLGAVVFGLPALFFALLSRSSEHELTSKVLLGPRLASLGCALTLWVTGVTIVWSPPEEALRLILATTALIHSAMAGWLIRIRYVGADN